MRSMTFLHKLAQGATLRWPKKSSVRLPTLQKILRNLCFEVYLDRHYYT